MQGEECRWMSLLVRCVSTTKVLIDTEFDPRLLMSWHFWVYGGPLALTLHWLGCTLPYVLMLLALDVDLFVAWMRVGWGRGGGVWLLTLAASQVPDVFYRYCEDWSCEMPPVSPHTGMMLTSSPFVLCLANAWGVVRCQRRSQWVSASWGRLMSLCLVATPLVFREAMCSPRGIVDQLIICMHIAHAGSCARRRDIFMMCHLCAMGIGLLRPTWWYTSYCVSAQTGMIWLARFQISR